MADAEDGYDELEDVPGVGPETAEALRAAGFESVEDLRTASVEELTDADGVGEARASELTDELRQKGPDDVGTDGGVTADVSATEATLDEDDSGESFGLLDARDTVEEVADALIDDPLDSIIELERGDDGWFAVVEVVERSAVPDTQDILGRYEIDLDTSGSVTAYRLTDRYRRGEVSG
ncbi:gas vesicle protein GvpO [Halorussus halophilus]|uniref:gas vesicle protein GvpO n=1 Tax=Halorussus halophilus TaxID=2650975 RepID=UPI00178837D7|nr:gas vesicle protein [Halorussus halophilus]